ncbi:TetR family transcriptional regulator [Pacificibacter maritimus]|uniref:TetR family transcriptional regulator n=1 Tax=Pacificibacter maritimus TaxID=762213 RepID=A0A3N4URM5_9RHOB|nr:TetR/AcrR family transcriptional regulator [Pacificibacter maritimus]RPE71315.1 TetR family transcriptional regulator [Pacificibacter maritimus]
MSLMENSKRAFDCAENTAEVADILRVARDLIERVGFSRFSMGELAQNVDMAKGAIYIFAETKEELFAELYLEALKNFISLVLPHAAMDTALTAEMLIAGKADPLFLPLMARFTTTIEPTLPREGLIETKRQVADQMERFAARLVKTRGLEHRRAVELAQALFVALQGASHLAAERPEHFDSLPDDVKDLYSLTDFDDAFARVARLILRGA